MKRILLAVLLLMGMGSPPAPRNEVIDLVVGGLDRHALVRIPASYGPEPVPVMISFHGKGGDGEDQRDLTHFNDVSDKHGFIVAYPDGIQKSWNALHGSGEAEALGVDDVAYVSALIDELQIRYRIDGRRIYVSGMSNGAQLAQRLGCQLSDRITAIASVAGQMSVALEPICAPGRPVPMISFHGTADKLVPYWGGETSGGGVGLSAPATARKWSNLNLCGLLTTETFRKGKVACRSFNACGSAPVTYCTVMDGGHTWPGGLQYLPALFVGQTNRDVDASEMIWQFVSQHIRD